MKVKNKTLTEYLNLSTEETIENDFVSEKEMYDDYLKKGVEAKDVFLFGSFMDLEFGFVKDLQEMINYSDFTFEELIKIIKAKTKKNNKQIGLISIFELKQQHLYFIDQIKIINTLESDKLGHEATHEEHQAGIEIFSKYRSFLQFDTLSGGDLLKFNNIRKLPYGTCFTKLLLNSDRSLFEKNLMNIRKPK